MKRPNNFMSFILPYTCADTMIKIRSIVFSFRHSHLHLVRVYKRYGDGTNFVLPSI